ncbi:MAG: hypothetical protein IRZ05_06220 [Micromonosporaceae bacterium]|jgi:DNA-binding beta-propeller fold protein YncE|nr:hypothetical protein [Micromonosporaceae bacterium]
MTTRRDLLRLAGTTALGIGVAACSTPEAAPPPEPLAGGDLLAVELADGLAVVDTATGRTVVPPRAGVMSPDWTILVQAQEAAGGTRVTARNVLDGTVMSTGILRDQLQPRAVSPDGRLVALTQPGDTGRTRTTVVVADSSGERRRLDLAGNLVPEAFSLDGRLLFVLDYLPPTAPDRYRVRVIDVAAGKVQPLSTRLKTAVPPGAEEEMRGEGRQAVYGQVQQTLFTLYTHQPDHVHTRDLLAGARAGKPGVHAFVHSLNLAQGWAFCIDLPAPFGEHPAAGHAIALSRSGSRLVVVDAPGGAAALIDPVNLTVDSVSRFAPLPESGAAAVLTPDAGRLLIGAGREVVMLPVQGGEPIARSTYDTPVRGLALSNDGTRLYVGQADGVVRQKLTDRPELTGDLAPTRTVVGGLRLVRRVVGPGR